MDGSSGAGPGRSSPLQAQARWHLPDADPVKASPNLCSPELKPAAGSCLAKWLLRERKKGRE
jgi:hypothetical protein